MIKRREMLAGVALALAAGDRVWAQASTRVWRVGYLNPRAGPGPADHPFVRSMRELGYVEGRNSSSNTGGRRTTSRRCSHWRTNSRAFPSTCS